MSEEEPKKYGLKLSQKSSAAPKAPIASVFGNDSDSDNDIAAEKDANKKFHMKYGSNKSRDQKAVEEVLADDPDAYEYDSLYDQMQSSRNAKTEEQKAADAKREPKYAHKIVLATQKRQMEQLMVEERKQAKEREAEGDEFKDKDAFVTGAYRKQIEERERIRKELEEQDRMDSRLKVEDQSMWQANFNRKLLDDMSNVKPVKEEETMTKAKDVVMKEESPELQQDKKLFHKELKPGLNKPTSTAKPKRSPTPERRSSRRDRERDDHHRKRRRSTSRERRRSSSRSRRRRHDSSDSSSPAPRSKENRNEKRHQEKKERPKSDKEILYERLEKVKEILKQRNTESDIFMAKQRYLQRKKNGEIRAPI